MLPKTLLTQLARTAERVGAFERPIQLMGDDVISSLAVDKLTAGSLQVLIDLDGEGRVYLGGQTSANPGQIVVNDTVVNRIVIGMFSPAEFGIKVANAAGTVIFQATDAGVFISGWTITPTQIFNGNTFLVAEDGGRITAGSAANTVGITGNGTDASSIGIWAGSTYANRATAPVRIRKDGQFYFGAPSGNNFVQWNGTTLTVRGTLNASDLTAGTINAISITGSTITGGTINGTTIIGATITGGTVRTAASGARVQMVGNTSRFQVFDSSLERVRIDQSVISLYGPNEGALGGTIVGFRETPGPIFGIEIRGTSRTTLRTGTNGPVVAVTTSSIQLGGGGLTSVLVGANLDMGGWSITSLNGISAGGTLSTTGMLHGRASGTPGSAVRVGDDAELWDMNTANTMFVRGLQNGGAAGFINAFVSAPSARWIKDEIVGIPSMLSRVKKLRPRKYHLRPGIRTRETKETDYEEREYFGLVLDEIPEELNEIIVSGGVDLYQYTTVLLKALQELSEKVSGLEAQLTEKG